MTPPHDPAGKRRPAPAGDLDAVLTPEARRIIRRAMKQAFEKGREEGRRELLEIARGMRAR